MAEDEAFGCNVADRTPCRLVRLDPGQRQAEERDRPPIGVAHAGSIQPEQHRAAATPPQRRQRPGDSRTEDSRQMRERSFVHLLDDFLHGFALTFGEMRVLGEVQQQRARRAVEHAIDEVAHHGADDLMTRLGWRVDVRASVALLSRGIPCPRARSSSSSPWCRRWGVSCAAPRRRREPWACPVARRLS